MFKIFTEAGYSKGFGHFSRISGICDRLTDQRIDFSLFIDADDVARRLIDRDYVKFESWLDETRIRELIKKDDIVLIDSYYYNVEFLDIIIDSCSKVIVIDDNKRLDYHDAVIINPNYFGEFLQYPQNRNNEYYLGHEYTLLRSEFIPDDKKTVKKDVERVLITMGGSDVANATHRVMKYMHDISESTALDVVVTEAYENLSEVNEVKRKGDSIITGATAGQMAELMRKARFCHIICRRNQQ